ncbi:MAG: CpaD family pilus assembly protein [Rhizobiales bacterium]|nr:CpaD family pilus assembly protein [Hyphomicrobiales bacterium]
MSNRPFPTARRSALPKAMLASAALLLAVAACKPVDSQSVTGSTLPDDYRVTHPISIEEAVDTMDVPVGMNSQHLTGGMRANVQGFGIKFLNSRSAVIAIVVPRGSANARVAGWLASEIQDALVGAGVSPKSIEMRSYRANKAEASAPIRIAYARIAAKTAGCGPWHESMMAGKDNTNYAAYGCASQQNLAAMVDNPLDLLYPRAMTPADTTRRVGVLDKYRTNSPTQGDYSKEVGGTIVQGVGN